MAPPHSRPPNGGFNIANSREIYCTGSYGRTSSYEKVIGEVNATRTLEEKNAVSTRKSVKPGNGKTQKERRSWNSRENPMQDAGSPDRVLLHKNAKNEKEEISNCHLSNLCDSAAKSVEKIVEKNIEAKEQSKALGILLREAQDQKELKLMKLKLNYIEYELARARANQSNIEAEQIKPAKFPSATPPSKKKPIAQEIQLAAKSTSPIAAATPKKRSESMASSYTEKKRCERSAAKLPSRQVLYFPALNKNPSILNTSERQASVVANRDALKPKERLEQTRQSLEKLEKWLEKPCVITPLQAFFAPPSNKSLSIPNPSAAKSGPSAAEKYRAPLTIATHSRSSRVTEHIPAPTRIGCGVKFAQVAVNFVTNIKFPMQIVHSPGKTDRHHQVLAKFHFSGSAESISRFLVRQNFHLRHTLSPQYLHPPNLKQKLDQSTRNPSNASVLKTLQDCHPDAQKFSMFQSSEETNNSSTLSPQYLFPPNFVTFENKKDSMAHIILPPPPQDRTTTTRMFKAQSIPRVVTQWSIISQLYFLRFNQRPPFIFSVV